MVRRLPLLASSSLISASNRASCAACVRRSLDVPPGQPNSRSFKSTWLTERCTGRTSIGRGHGRRCRFAWWRRSRSWRHFGRGWWSDGVRRRWDEDGHCRHQPRRARHRCTRRRWKRRGNSAPRARAVGIVRARRNADAWNSVAYAWSDARGISAATVPPLLGKTGGCNSQNQCYGKRNIKAVHQECSSRAGGDGTVSWGTATWGTAEWAACRGTFRLRKMLC